MAQSRDLMPLLLMLILMAFLAFPSYQIQQANSQLRTNHQTLRNIESHTRASAKSVEAMCRDAVTPPSSC